MASTQKSVNVVVLATYTFKQNASRVCFTVLSSDGSTRYNTCFEAGRASCNCPARVECKHIKTLRERAAALMTPCKVEQVAPAAYSTSEQRAAAPLNGNRGFSLMR